MKYREDDTQKDVERFDSLPDVAMTNVTVLCALLKICESGYYRGAKRGIYPEGYKLGALRRFRVGEVRSFLNDPAGWAKASSVKKHDNKKQQ